MSYQIPYESATYKPDNALIPGNQESDNPVIFELEPAGGADLARLKSVLWASSGLVSEATWTPDLQAAVIGSFDTGAPVFERCITSIQGLTVPAAMAVRVGLLAAVPVRADGDGKVRPDPKAPVPITTGLQFSKVVGFMTALALSLCFELMKISDQVAKLDTRLFAQPSGSPSTETPGRPTGTVRRARKASGRRETAV